MAAPRRLFMTLSDDRNLRRFVVQARSTGKQLGIGSYGAVEEVIERLTSLYREGDHTEWRERDAGMRETWTEILKRERQREREAKGAPALFDYSLL